MSKPSENVFSINLRAIRLLASQNPLMFPQMLYRAAVNALLPCCNVYFSARLIGELSGARRPEALLFWAGITVGVNAFFRLLSGLFSHVYNIKSANFWYTTKRLEDDKFLSLDYCDVEDQKTRDLVSQIDQNANWTGWGFSLIQWRLEGLLQSLLTAVGSVALVVGLFLARVPEEGGSYTFLNHPLFLFLLLGSFGLILRLNSYLGERAQTLRANASASATLDNRQFGHFGFLSADEQDMMDYRIYHQEKVAAYYSQKDSAFLTGGLFHKLAIHKIGPMYVCGQLAEKAMILGIYLFVCLKAWAGAFGIGLVVQYITAMQQFTGSIRSFIDHLQNLKVNTRFLQDIFRFLDMPNNMYQGSLTTEKRSDRKYNVEFKNVSFRYPNTDRWVLRNVNLKFEVGSRLAVVGENGSGKSTFIKLLCRLYDPQEGEILLNGVNIKKYKYDDYIRLFSVVFQDFWLIAQRLGENVAGSDAVDREKALKCLEKAGMGERLRELPDGLDTWLYKSFDEDGLLPSGGETQKIAIARALYKDAPFLVLDEPTASLDPVAEAEIYQKFDDIAGDHTVLYISHRLSSCRFCQKILVFRDGSVVQQGSHEELLASEGPYRELWHAQAKYYELQKQFQEEMGQLTAAHQG